MFDGEAFGQEMVEIVRGHVARATEPLIARIAELEKAVAAPGPIGFADAMIDKDGCLVLVDGTGRTKSLGVVVGKDGERGDDGETLTLDNFNVVRTDERTIEIEFTKGDMTHSFELEFPFPIYRNAFKEGETYSPGDMVSWAGSVWHCAKATSAKPGDGDEWTLAVKRGRDGKNAQ